MNKLLNYFEEIIVVVVLVVMSTIAFVNVLTRNFFDLSLSFTEEITVNLFVFLTFVGAAIGVRRNAHLGFTLLLDSVPFKVQRFITLFIGIITTFFFIVITYYAYDMIQFQISVDAKTPALGWPRWIFSSGIIVGTVLCIIRTIQATIVQFKGQNHKQGGVK